MWFPTVAARQILIQWGKTRRPDDDTRSMAVLSGTAHGLSSRPESFVAHDDNMSCDGNSLNWLPS